jgi:hypothetical protein
LLSDFPVISTLAAKVSVGIVTYSTVILSLWHLAVQSNDSVERELIQFIVGRLRLVAYRIS